MHAGLLCLVGLKAADAAQDSEMMINKVLSARVFHDSETGKKWASSVSDIGGELLFVSQFTLYGSLRSKNPSFSRSMKSAEVRFPPSNVVTLSSRAGDVSKLSLQYWDMWALHKLQVLLLIFAVPRTSYGTAGYIRVSVSSRAHALKAASEC